MTRETCSRPPDLTCDLDDSLRQDTTFLCSKFRRVLGVEGFELKDKSLERIRMR